MEKIEELLVDVISAYEESTSSAEQQTLWWVNTVIVTMNYQMMRQINYGYNNT